MNIKELLAIVEYPKQLLEILFIYEINTFSYHKNLVTATTLSEFQRLMRQQLILGEFGPNIQHIYGVNNIVADMLSKLTSTSIDK